MISPGVGKDKLVAGRRNRKSFEQILEHPHSLDRFGIRRGHGVASPSQRFHQEIHELG
ncbi:hypothetical protein CY34DRAFT_802319 [Suillus luteus UH-Slu-Lm8-n1]|uniref:Uncharacterized protein n=1 Tax=Suillus luteus UH-Slu-Lm8-n1 TaxID=930992 RepID=A0A0D0ASX2_9AGAM|nr:hypothetical protein CY34DRAFT_802319 [Suillus luteus UH-Slu-Lm8-n1]